MFELAAIKSFITSPLFKYIAIALAVLAIVFVIFRTGEAHVQSKWDAANAIAEKEIAELRAKANQVTTNEVIKYVDRVKTVTVKGDTITEYVDRFISPAEDAKCIIPNNFILLHDSAVKNVVPEGVPAK